MHNVLAIIRNQQRRYSIRKWIGRVPSGCWPVSTANAVSKNLVNAVPRESFLWVATSPKEVILVCLLSMVVRQHLSYMILKALNSKPNSFYSGRFHLGFRNISNASFFQHHYEIHSVHFAENKLNPIAPFPYEVSPILSILKQKIEAQYSWVRDTAWAQSSSQCFILVRRSHTKMREVIQVYKWIGIPIKLYNLYQ